MNKHTTTTTVTTRKALPFIRAGKTEVIHAKRQVVNALADYIDEQFAEGPVTDDVADVGFADTFVVLERVGERGVTIVVCQPFSGVTSVASDAGLIDHLRDVIGPRSGQIRKADELRKVVQCFRERLEEGRHEGFFVIHGRTFADLLDAATNVFEDAEMDDEDDFDGDDDDNDNDNTP